MKIKIEMTAGGHTMPFTKGEVSFLGLLEEDKLFEILITNVREELGIPPKGFDFPLKDKASIKNIETKKLKNASIIFCQLYNLPLYWMPTFYLYLLFNVAMKIDESLSYQPVTISKRDGKVTLEINETMSLEEFERIIKSNSSGLKNWIGNLPQRPKTEIKNLELRKEIAQVVSSFRNVLNPKSYREIADYFNKKYGNRKMPLDVNDESVLREYASRNIEDLNRQIDTKKIDLLSLVMGTQDITKIFKK